MKHKPSKVQLRHSFEDICASRAGLELESIVTFAAVLGVDWREGLMTFLATMTEATEHYIMLMKAEQEACATEKAGL